MKKTLTILLVAFIANMLPVTAIRPLLRWYSYKQADGSRVTVRKEGNGLFGYYVNTEGLALLHDGKGNLTYARQAGDMLLPTTVIAHDKEAQTAAEVAFLRSEAAVGTAQAYDILATASPVQITRDSRASSASTEDGLGAYGQPGNGIVKSIGTPQIPVVMVSFADKDFRATTTIEKVSRMLNENNYADEKGCAGSVRDYFTSQSDGLFIPAFDVVARVRVSNNYAYYGADAGSTIDAKKYELIQEALNLAYEQGTDFGKYASEGAVPLVVIFFAGPGQHSAYEEGNENYLWAHFSPRNFKVGETTVNSYFIGNEVLQSYEASPDNPQVPVVTGEEVDGIGILCHEFGHALGLPDFYYTGSNATIKDTLTTMGYWSVMDYGNYYNNGYAPVGYNAYERSMLGWLKVKELTQADYYTLYDFGAPEETDRAFCIRNPENEKEYYLLENRQAGTWYPSVMGHGMLVTHVDYDRAAWNGNRVNNVVDHQRFSFIPADNSNKIEGSLPRSYGGDPYPGRSGNTELSDFSTPAAKVFSPSGLMSKPIYGITENNGLISFAYLDKGLTGISKLPAGDDASESHIYTIDGRRVSNIGTMPRGIYIVKDGKNNKTIWK